MKILIKKILVICGLMDKVYYFRLKKQILNNVKVNGQCINYCDVDLYARNREIYFIHIPKAAGMSVVDVLYGEKKSHHATAFDYLKQDEIKFKGKPSFSISRNPYERLYSAYNYLKSGGMNIIDKVWWDIYLSKYEDFEDFVVSGGLEKAIQDKAEHFRPQYEFIYDDSDNLLCDFVGKLESVSDVESFLCEKLGREVFLSKRNVVNHREVNIKNVYSESMLFVVNRLYEKDFKLLGYDVF
ncbi:sulfotransferase family protein [Shewanella sp. A25]|nr:sulfotransferase family protein [Shewanella shenzhenensis]